MQRPRSPKPGGPVRFGSAESNAFWFFTASPRPADKELKVSSTSNRAAWRWSASVRLCSAAARLPAKAQAVFRTSRCLRRGQSVGCVSCAASRSGASDARCSAAEAHWRAPVSASRHTEPSCFHCRAWPNPSVEATPDSRPLGLPGLHVYHRPGGPSVLLSGAPHLQR